MRRCLLLAIGFLLVAPAVRAQDELALVGDADWTQMREEAGRVIKALDALKSPLPADTVRSLKALLDSKPEDEPEAVRAVQRLLDAHCLLGVSINPESRVKAARGGARAELIRGRLAHVLVKVHNDGGVTAPLAVEGEQLLGEKAEAGRWLKAEVLDREPLRRKLSGRKVQYVILALTAGEAGKREATLRFDVGQGTQDLGFRAEVPVLFTIKE
jgi:hypothetical protein